MAHVSSSSSVEGIVLEGLGAWQEGEGKPPAEGDASISRTYQEGIQNAFNPTSSGQTECSACSGRDEITFDGGLGKASRYV